MKILQIHTTLRTGGIETFITELSNALCKTQKVTVCTIFEPTKKDILVAKLNPAIQHISIGKRKSGFSLKEIWKIYKLLNNGDFDIVQMHGCFYYYALSILLLHRKCKFFYTIHSDAAKENLTWDRLILPFKRFAFRHKWAHAITISHQSQNSFYKVYKNVPNQMIYNGVCKPIATSSDYVMQFRFTRHTKIFLHAGRITEAKNQLALCQAFSKLICDGKDVVLLICGPKEDCDIYNQLSPYFNKRIVYLGERNDVPELMTACDAFCLPSIWEGLPITLLEAISVGCIPICTRVGGIPEIITDKHNGVLANSTEVKDIMLSILRFLSLSDDVINTMKANAAKTFDQFTIDNSASEYLKCYSSCI